jgi:hypothetical protein
MQVTNETAAEQALCCNTDVGSASFKLLAYHSALIVTMEAVGHSKAGEQSSMCAKLSALVWPLVVGFKEAATMAPHYMGSSTTTIP